MTQDLKMQQGALVQNLSINEYKCPECSRNIDINKSTSVWYKYKNECRTNIVCGGATCLQLKSILYCNSVDCFHCGNKKDKNKNWIVSRCVNKNSGEAEILILYCTFNCYKEYNENKKIE